MPEIQRGEGNGRGGVHGPLQAPKRDVHPLPSTPSKHHVIVARYVVLMLGRASTSIGDPWPFATMVVARDAADMSRGACAKALPFFGFSNVSMSVNSAPDTISMGSYRSTQAPKIHAPNGRT